MLHHYCAEHGKLLSLPKVDYLHKPFLFQYFDFNFIVLLTSHWDSMFKPESGTSDGTTAQQNSDICQPLHTLVLCQHLNASAALCRPSGWAGDAILKAVNTTREALARLYLPLQTKVRHNIPSGYMTSSNASYPATIFARQKILTEVVASTMKAEFILLTIRRILSGIAVSLIAFSAVSHAQLYLFSDGVCTDSRQTFQENKFLFGRWRDDNKSNQLWISSSRLDRQLSSSEGLFAIALLVLLGVVCYLCDGVLFWVLSLVRHYAKPPFDFTGSRSLYSTTKGDGPLATLLYEFLRGFHAGHWFGIFDGSYTCLSHPNPPRLLNFTIVLALSVVFVVGTALKRTIFFQLNKLCGYFYPERESERLDQMRRMYQLKRAHMMEAIRDAVKDPSSRTDELLRELISCDRVEAPSNWSRITFRRREKQNKSVNCGLCGCATPPRSTEISLSCFRCQQQPPQEQQQQQHQHPSQQQQQQHQSQQPDINLGCQQQGYVENGVIYANVRFCPDCLDALGEVCPYCSTSNSDATQRLIYGHTNTDATQQLIYGHSNFQWRIRWKVK